MPKRTAPRNTVDETARRAVEDEELERVRALIRLAVQNPSEEEARSAALLAVRTIDKLRLRIVADTPSARPASRTTDTPPVIRPTQLFMNPLLPVAQWVVWGMGVWWLVNQIRC